MVDSKFFGIPFGVSGDKATIPEDTQPSGAVSYQQGFGPDYERDPTTDPLAKRVPRDETNELYYQITNAMRFLQLYGVPEWYELDDNGDPVSYSQGAMVRTTVAGVTTVWYSTVNTNTEEPGSVSGPTAKWTDVSPYVTQSNRNNYAVAGGTANALAATLPLAPLALVDGLIVQIKTALRNTAAATLNLNGLGAAPIVVNASGAALTGGELQGIVTLQYDSGSWRLMTPVNRGFQNVQYFTPSGDFIVPAGVTRLQVTVKGGGGGGSHCAAAGGSGLSGGGGGEGGTAIKVATVTPGDIIPVTVGAGGLGNTGSDVGINGGTSSFGAFCSATGGQGATFQAATSSSGAGGGNATGGDLNINGAPGFDGQSGTFVFAGQGGGAGGGKAGTLGGGAAVAPGCGGGGAYDSLNTGVVRTGGAGTAGIVVVEW